MKIEYIIESNDSPCGWWPFCATQDKEQAEQMLEDRIQKMPHTGHRLIKREIVCYYNPD
jgi:hypothetical protein